MGGNKAILLLFVATLSIVWAAQSPNLEKTTLKDGKRVQKVKKGSLRDDSATENYYESVDASDEQNNKEPLSDEAYQDHSDGQAGSEVNNGRPLTAGDYFTAAEMLPIAEKLIAKVEQPGMGKGIVSKSRNPKKLADELFIRFFETSTRLVKLTDFDIVSLDALQALALSGEPANLRSYYVETSTLPNTITYYKGQYGGFTLANDRKKSKYWLLNKKQKSNITKVLHEKAKAEKKADEKAKLLHAKKFLRNALKAIQGGRNITHIKQRMNASIIHQTKKKESDLIDLKGNTKVKGKPMRPVKKNLRNKEVKQEDILDVQAKPMGPPKTIPKNKIIKSVAQEDEKTKKPLCTWKYVCTNPNNIDTCHLKTACDKQSRKHAKRDNIDALGISHNPDEHTNDMKQFRKMIGVTLVDEEVEKILESRSIHQLYPSHEGKQLKRAESLSEYFNSIIMSQVMRTTALYQSGEHTKQVDEQPRGPNPGYKDSQSETELGSSERVDSETEVVRRVILRRDLAKPTLTVSASTATTPYKVA